MATSSLNVRVDANDKKNFEQFCNNVGMNVSTAVNMFIKAVLREQKLPFEIRDYNLEEVTYNKLLEAERELETTTKRYSADEVLKSMNDNIR